VAARAGPPPSPGGPSENEVEGLALGWFNRMQTAQIDRTRLIADYSPRLTDEAVQAMSRYIKDNDCGSARTGAQELQTGAAGSRQSTK
jgi:hypothetical protein